MPFCPKCGARTAKEDEFCRECGARITKLEEPKKKVGEVKPAKEPKKVVEPTTEARKLPRWQSIIWTMIMALVWSFLMFGLLFASYDRGSLLGVVIAFGLLAVGWYALWWDWRGSRPPLTDKRVIGVPVVPVILVLLFALGILGFQYLFDSSAIYQMEVILGGRGPVSVGSTSITFPLYMYFTNNSDTDTSSPPSTLTYQVRVSGSIVATGSTSVGSIPARQIKVSTLNISVSYSEVGSAIWNTISSGSFSVEITGTLEARAAFGLIPITKSFSTSYSL